MYIPTCTYIYYIIFGLKSFLEIVDLLGLRVEIEHRMFQMHHYILTIYWHTHPFWMTSNDVLARCQSNLLSPEKKWCWKGKGIFTRNRFSKGQLSILLLYYPKLVSPCTLQVKNRYNFHLYKFNFFCGVCEVIERWAKVFVGTCEFLRLKKFFDGFRHWWSWREGEYIKFFFQDITTKANVASDWCLESGWNDIVCHLRYTPQLINHNF